VRSPSCGCRVGLLGIGFSDQAAPARPSLSKRQRGGRAVVAVGLLALAPAALRMPRFARVPLAALIAWLGLSHVVAAATGYSGCPELGAVPSLLLRRQVHTRCGPWERLDDRFGLRDQPADQEEVRA
jgi:hypothetical protein